MNKFNVGQEVRVVNGLLRDHNKYGKVADVGPYEPRECQTQYLIEFDGRKGWVQSDNLELVNSANETDLQDYWHHINDDTFVISSPQLEDYKAVMGAKTSRAPDMVRKSLDLDSEGKLSDFLSMNLAGYGHASIGEMANPWVHHRGFGTWLGYLLTDNPLFIGQEVSTRAVDVGGLGAKIVTNDDGFPDTMAYDAPEELREQHDKLYAIFTELKQGVGKGGWKFDDIRWALPSTVKTGITTTYNARALIRHLERIEGLGNWTERTVDNFYKGVKACSPETFKSLKRERGRQVPHAWKTINTFNPQSTDPTPTLDKSLRLSANFFPWEELILDDIESSIDPREKGEYLDDYYNRIGRFDVEIFCSVAVARDWHRHRSVMPWDLEVVQRNGLPVLCPWFDYQDRKDEVQDIMNKSYDYFKKVNGTTESLRGLYTLPFGAMVRMTCKATLPALLYMMELRFSTSGANFEYKEQARQGLIQLCDILGPDFVKYHGIDRTLQAAQRG